jgi:protein gp37
VSDRSLIEWLLGGATWNFLVGCSPASVGCEHCFAEAMTRRLAGSLGGPYRDAIADGHWSGRVLFREDKVLDPERWRKPRLVFVNSMADTFHAKVPEAVLDRAFDVMERVDRHTYLLLTKRAGLMREYLARRYPGGAPRHIWAGASVCTQEDLERQAQHLVATPAAVRFLSCEPLLGPLDLQYAAFNGADSLQSLAGIDWVIVGGESGPKARPCDVAWIRSIVAQCRAASVPAFCKQLGANIEDRNDAGFDGDTPTSWPMDTDVEHDENDTGYQGAPIRIRTRDRKGGDMEEWPADLRVRELPTETRDA